MGEFVRSRSKVWWGSYRQGAEEGVEDVEEEEWGVAARSRNDLALERVEGEGEGVGERGSSGSPESHKSQDSGFSDSEGSSPASGGAAPGRIPRPTLSRKKKRPSLTSSSLPPEDTKDTSLSSSSSSSLNPEESANQTRILKTDRIEPKCTTTLKTPVKEDERDLVKNDTPEGGRVDPAILTVNDIISYQNHSNNTNEEEERCSSSFGGKYFSREQEDLKDSCCSRSRYEEVTSFNNYTSSSSSSSAGKTPKTVRKIYRNASSPSSSSPVTRTIVDYEESFTEQERRRIEDQRENAAIEDMGKYITCSEVGLRRAKSDSPKEDGRRTLERCPARYSDSPRTVEESEGDVWSVDDGRGACRSDNEKNSKRIIQLNRSLDEKSCRLSSVDGDSTSFDSSSSTSSSSRRGTTAEETARYLGGNISPNCSSWSIPGPPPHASTPKSGFKPKRFENSPQKPRRPVKLDFNQSGDGAEESAGREWGDPPVDCWLKELRVMYEPECMTTLQSKSLTADLSQQVTVMAAVTTEAVRNLQLQTRLVSAEFSKLYRQVESGVAEHVGPLVQSLVGHMTEFLRTCRMGRDERQRLSEASDRLRTSAFTSPPDRKQLSEDTANLGREFTRCVDLLLFKQIQVLMTVLEEESAEPVVTLAALSSLTSGLGLEGKHLSELVARCGGGIRALLMLCFESNNASVRTAALRTLATVCCSTHTIRQLEKAGGVEILTEILQDEEKRSEAELTETVSVIVQITAPWIEDNHSVIGLSQQLTPLVSSLTRMVNNTTECTTLLLCAAALSHLSQLEPQCVWTMLENSTVGTLLLAIRRQGPFASVFLREQAAGLLANMSAAPEARSHLAEHRAVVALLCFLQVRHSPLQQNSEIAAAERLQHKSAIALSRMCSDPEVAAQVVELQGVHRLVRLCREERERNHSDGVLVACLAALRKIVANCGSQSVEELNALELVEPRLLDSFLIYSSRQESYV